MTKSMKEPDFTMGSDSEDTPRNKLQDQHAKTQNIQTPKVDGPVVADKGAWNEEDADGEDKNIDLL